MPYYVETENRYNLMLSAATGFVFFSGWWIYIDILANHFQECIENTPSLWPGLIGSFMILAVNCTPYRDSRESNLYDVGYCSPTCAIIVLFTSFIISFGTCIWGFFIAIQNFILDKHLIWPAVAIMIQNVCIILSNLGLKFSKQIKYVY